MSFFQRAVTLAAISLGLVGLAGISTPGLAFETNRIINVSSTGPVPAPPSVPGTTLNSSSTDAQALPDLVLPGHEAPAKAVTADVVLPAQAQPATPQGATFQYASLSAAVDAQDAPGAVGGDLTCLAGAIYFEAKGEPLAGQLAVAEVILNRAKSGRFPASVCSVVTQRGQFSFVRGGAIPSVADCPNYRTAVAVAQVALADAWDSPAGGALYFHARRVSPPFRATKVAAIGNHIFYR